VNTTPHTETGTWCHIGSYIWHAADLKRGICMGTNAHARQMYVWHSISLATPQVPTEPCCGNTTTQPCTNPHNTW
jgi:hypothetical protein